MARGLAVIKSVLLALLFALVFTADVAAETSNVTIEVIPQLTTVRIERTGESGTSWSFRDSYGNLVGLGSRIKNFEAFDAGGKPVNVRALAPGQFASALPASRVRYEVNIVAPSRSTNAALVSWLNAEHGILRLSDLVPLPVVSRATVNGSAVNVRLRVPEGWGGYCDEEVTALGSFRFLDINSAVFVVGKNVRRSVRNVSPNLFKLLTDEAWVFGDDEAVDTVARIIKLHNEVGSVPCGQVTLALLPFPGMAANSWSAETRGCTVTLLMGKLPSKTAALAQLGNALTHELFHLWIPNGVALTGDYDWFYEGFTMYQAARAAVRLGYVSFPEFLNAIARAHDGSASPTQLSLIEASKQRWTVGAPSVYSKAMVVAFLYDLNLRYQSKGKLSLNDAYRKIMRENARGSAANKTEADGNAVLIPALRSDALSTDLIERFVRGPQSIDLRKELAPFGLRVDQLVRTHISVDDHLTSQQRDLLKQLGYNEPRRRNAD
jgi:hypothetical protein